MAGPIASRQNNGENTSATRDLSSTIARKMTNAAIEEGIQDFLITEVFYDTPFSVETLTPTTSLVDMLDSLRIMRIVSFCEEAFGVEVSDTEILPEHFENIRAIANLIAGCQKI